MANLGFLAALLTALCWGSYMVPFKKSGSLNLIQFQALMVVGIGFSGLFLSLILDYPLSLNPYGLLSGALWAIANTIALVAISSLGLSRAVPIMASLVITLSFFWGALVFNELPSGLLTGFSGIGLIILGVILISAAVLVAVLWGLFYFKEVVNARARVQVLIGAMVLLGGVAVLSLA